MKAIEIRILVQDHYDIDDTIKDIREEIINARYKHYSDKLLIDSFKIREANEDEQSRIFPKK